MAIRIWEEGPIFQIQTAHTTYLMGVVMGRYLGHLYYGARMEDHRALYLARSGAEADEAFLKDKLHFLDRFYFEYPVSGGGDFRDACLRVRDSQGRSRVELCYEGYRLLSGKPALEGLPAAFAGKSEAETLPTRTGPSRSRSGRTPCSATSSSWTCRGRTWRTMFMKAWPPSCGRRKSTMSSGT